MAWGDACRGGEVPLPLAPVSEMWATANAFAALLEDESVVCWGDEDSGGDCSQVRGELRQVQSLAASNGAFAALRHDGSVVTWGDPDYGGDSSEVQQQLRRGSGRMP